MSSDRPLVLGTRGSALALVQASAVQCAFEECASIGRPVERRIIKTTGDRRQDIRLSEVGRPGGVVDKGVFTKELEEALRAGEIHIAVHSLKDVPTELEDDFVIAGVLPRAPIEDVLIMKTASSLADLPEGGRVATSSVRRECQLRHLRPDLEVVEIRGNVPTRIRKLVENDGLDAIMLARAGLERLGFEGIGEGKLRFEEVVLKVDVLDREVFLPAAGQGIVGIEARSSDEESMVAVASINDEETFLRARAEREFLRLLEAGCQTPVGVHTWIEGGRLWMKARVFDEDEWSRPPEEGAASGPGGDPEAVAAKLVQALG